jgi:hypothetical protein
MPTFDPADLAGRAAFYIANYLTDHRLLVATDRDGYNLALELAAYAGPAFERVVRAQLGPLVERSIDVGQEPPEGW